MAINFLFNVGDNGTYVLRTIILYSPHQTFTPSGAFRVLEHDMNSVQRLIEHTETLGFIHRAYLRVSCFYENDNKQKLFPTDRITGGFFCSGDTVYCI